MIKIANKIDAAILILKCNNSEIKYKAASSPKIETLLIFKRISKYTEMTQIIMLKTNTSI